MYFFPGRSPNQAMKHFIIKHGTQQSVLVRGHREREAICRLCTAGVGRKAQALLRAPSFPLALNLCLKLFIKCNFSKAIPNAGRAQSPAQAMCVHFAPRAQLSRYVTPRYTRAHRRLNPPPGPTPTPTSHQPNAEQLHENSASHFCSDRLRPATIAIICISCH